MFELKQESPQDVTYSGRVRCIDLPPPAACRVSTLRTLEFPCLWSGSSNQVLHGFEAGIATFELCCNDTTVTQQQSKRRRVGASDAEDGPSRVNDDPAGDAILPLEAAAAAAGDGVGGGSSDEQEGQKCIICLSDDDPLPMHPVGVRVPWRRWAGARRVQGRCCSSPLDTQRQI